MAPPGALVEGNADGAVAVGAQIDTGLLNPVNDGRAPGLARIEELFSDTIHVNPAGAYLIALSHLGVIYGRDPRDVPRGMGRTEIPASETATWMQELVHAVLRDHPDTGYPPAS